MGEMAACLYTDGHDPVQTGISTLRWKYRRTSGTWLYWASGEGISGQGGTGLSCSERENPVCLHAYLGTCGLLLPLLFSHQ